ncbi:pentapeptide repeat-containing protein [Saccharomonospora azurea]|uniref:pentapeptide repeat-containing protein n=1 Tax=Saccharomonospora azurea TaxID=40988 RepID=UPI0024094DE5|nr:pentapeptide repeat-containing protein [Saccharomonospora azurea]
MARCPSGTERTSREATSTSVRSNGRSSPTVFEGANLSNVTFAGADLVGANFVGVKSIAGADFSAAIGVDRALNLANAPGAESAIWP